MGEKKFYTKKIVILRFLDSRQGYLTINESQPSIPGLMLEEWTGDNFYLPDEIIEELESDGATVILARIYGTTMERWHLEWIEPNELEKELIMDLSRAYLSQDYVWMEEVKTQTRIRATVLHN